MTDFDYETKKGIGNRIEGWVDRVSAKWKDALRGWFARWLAEGFTGFLESEEPALVEETAEMFAKAAAAEDIPVEIRNLLQRVGKGEKWVHAVLMVVGGAMMLVSLVASLYRPALTLMGHKQSRGTQEFRFDPATITALLHRNPELYAHFREDLKDEGWSDARIAAFDELLKAIPPLSDMVRFADFSAFDQAVIDKFPGAWATPQAVRDAFKLSGVYGDWVNRYWFSHWRQPGGYELSEMRRRGLIDDDAVKLAYRAGGTSEYWQDNLLKLVKAIPTRVDVRRFRDMRVITKEELSTVYEAHGYSDDYNKWYVTWTEIYNDFPLLMNRWRNGWITLADVKQRLITLGLPEDRVEEFIQEKVTPEEAERVDEGRQLTKTDIYKGAKQDRITREEAVQLLVDLGYDTDEAEYLMAVNVPPDETEPAVKERELTKGDIKTAVRQRLMTPGEALERLSTLRYSATDADLLVSIYQALIPVEDVETERELTKGDITSLLRKDVLLPAEARQMLADLRYGADDINRLIDANLPPEPAIIDIEKTRQLTKGDITGALKRGNISPDEARQMLFDLKYSASDADYLVSTNLPLPAAIEEARDRELGKSEIKSALDAGLISSMEAFDRLIAMDYNAEDSGLLVTLYISLSTLADVKRKQLAKTDVKSALKAGIINSSEAKQRLQEVDYSSEDADFLVGLYLNLIYIGSTTKSKEDVRQDIVEGVKKGLLTNQEAFTILTQIGFTESEAQFIMMVNAETSPFSPTSFAEFKELTDMYKRATGKTVIDIEVRIRLAASDLLAANNQVQALQSKLDNLMVDVVDFKAIPAEGRRLIEDARIDLHRSETNRDKAQVNYDDLIAQFKRHPQTN